MTVAGEDDRGTAVAAVLMSHPAVASIIVPVTSETIAYLVPDELEAPILHRACQLESRGELDGLSWHEPSVDLLVAQVNRTETDFLFREIFADRVYLEGGIELPEGAVVVDIGANIGMFTLFAAAESAGARVVAVEPVAELARAVAVNVALHAVDATVLNCAVGREAGEIDFTFYPNNSVMSGAFADASDRDVLRDYLLTGDAADDSHHLDSMVAGRMVAVRRTVPMRTLSDIVASEGLRRVDLLKIDVEKAEAEVLAGIDDPTWALVRQVVVEVHDIDGRLATLCALLRHRGFEVDVHRDPRLAGTPCFNVYGRRPTTTLGPPRRVDPGRWPTQSALSADLRATVARQRPDLDPPARYVLVSRLEDVLDEVVGPQDAVAAAGQGKATAVLAEIWAELFGATAVHDSANFFDLGGDSLTAVRLLAQLEDRLGEDALAPDAVFTAGSFAQLAAILERGPAPADRR
jgi:FkbM family methyltransferase